MGRLVPVDSLRAHPTLTETIPPLSEDEFSDLLESLRTFGQKQDIVVDAEDVIIDGHNRWRAAKELGWEKVSVFPELALSVEMAERLGIELNSNRRHWSREQRRAAVVRLIMLEPARSDRDIGRSAGASHPTVAMVRSELEASGAVVKLSTRTDVTGREQPASKPARTPKLAKDQPKQVHEKPEDIAAQIASAARSRIESAPEAPASPSSEGTDAPEQLEETEAGVPVGAFPHVAIDGGLVRPSDVVAEARREFKASPIGRGRAYLVKLGTTPEFLPEEMVEFAQDFTPGELYLLRLHRDLINRILESAAKEKIRVVR